MQKLLTKTEIAELLNVSVSTIEHYVFFKKIPFIKIGKLVRFSEDEISKWVQEGFVEINDV